MTTAPPAVAADTAPLRVCVDARLTSGQAGGVEQAVIGLATGLSALTDGDEQYLFHAGDWIDPYLSGPCRRLTTTTTTTTTAAAAGPASRPRLRTRVARVARRLLPAAATRAVDRLRDRGPVVPRSDGTLEAAGVDLVHFTHAPAFLTAVPSLYQPWDLQHRHLPQFFTAREYQSRELCYRAFCDQAAAVAVATSWGRRDLLEQFGLPPDKVIVVPAAAPTTAYAPPDPDAMAAAQRQHDLPDAFVYFPAQTWPHKNHLTLLAALRLLRDQDGLVVPLVCSGFQTDFFPTIAARAAELGLGPQVRFLGFVDPPVVRCLYRLCRALVFPSKFEGWGLPVTEAFHAGVPVACSSAACLPDQAGGAALVFDPDDPAAIAAAVRQLWTEPATRDDLARRGRARVATFSWDLTARLYRAHYRRLAGRPLGEADLALLAAPPVV
jgi:glycosyltransferase involved in cell wall biosynthesis